MARQTIDVFKKVSNGYFGTFSPSTNRLVPLNPPLENIFGSREIKVKLFIRSPGAIFGSFKGIPIRLIIVDEYVQDETYLVEAFVAQTKTSEYVTDFTRLADLATDGLWEWFPSLDYEYMSERFWSILGYEQKEMEERPSSWTGKIDPVDGKKALDLFREHTESKGAVPYHATVRYRHKDGRDVHIVCRGSVVEWLPDGSPWRIIGTHTDVTDIMFKDALESREKFVSRMSHEIRSPLCAVLNECDLLGEKYDLSVIKDSCTQILYIANDVLSLNKLKGDNITLDLETCDPEEVIMKAIKRHRMEFKKKGLRLSSSTGDVPSEIKLDKSKFNQILDNVMSNALKYTNKGRVSLDCDYDYDDSFLVVTIEDTGVGIPDDEKESIFNEFFQGSSSMRGIGIGLHIVKKLCELMGGYIEVVDSEVGRGTTMRFGVRADVVVASAEDSNLVMTKSLRVLVVDDIATNRKYLNRKLTTLEEDMGFTVSEVVEAIDGEDAVRVFNKSDDRFDIVLMDCLMPIMDGFEATREIHLICDRKKTPRVPVVAVTASIADDIYGKCKDAGMTCVVTKPFSLEDLRNSMEQANVLD